MLGVARRPERVIVSPMRPGRNERSPHGNEPTLTDTLVRACQIKRNATGEDIANYTADDAYLNIYLEDVEVELERLITELVDKGQGAWE
jgi:hypothetical protein